MNMSMTHDFQKLALITQQFFTQLLVLHSLIFSFFIFFKACHTTTIFILLNY